VASIAFFVVFRRYGPGYTVIDQGLHGCHSPGSFFFLLLPCLKIVVHASSFLQRQLPAGVFAPTLLLVRCWERRSVLFEKIFFPAPFRFRGFLWRGGLGVLFAAFLRSR